MIGDNTVIVKLSRWGNSLAVRIPKDALEGSDLHEGDRFTVVVEGGRLVLVPQTTSLTLDHLMGAITPENLQTAEFDTGWR